MHHPILDGKTVEAIPLDVLDPPKDLAVLGRHCLLSRRREGVRCRVLLGLLARVVFRTNDVRVKGTDTMSLNNGFSPAQSKMRNVLRHAEVGPCRELLRRRKIKPFAQAHHPCAGDDGYGLIKRMPMGWHLEAISMFNANDIRGAYFARVS
jgi:hypothetical protein